MLRSGLLLGSETVALYSAFRDEADPTRVAEAALKRGLKTAYPRIEGETLVFCVATPEELNPAPPLGIPEPSRDAPRAEKVDLFVVPGLGFTAEGDRVGWGKGYYDRALAAHPGAKAIGFGFACQLVEALPTESHDRRLDAVAAGARLLWTK